MFRLLALNILDDCAACAHKVLKPGTLYRFCQDYDRDDTNPCNLRRVYELSEVEKNLYNVKSVILTQEGRKEKDISITINAIVGKNGDGKSSIVEIILRVLNNYAYSYGYMSDQSSLEYNVSVGAILYYECDEHVYAIECPQNKDSYIEASVGDKTIKKLNVQLYKDGTNISNEVSSVTSDADKKKWLKDNHIDELFYSMVINYSIYSYNSRLFGQENEGERSWIDSLFHKNDSYQTPVVLNPMRTEGNIDINREEMLAHQRLMSLYTLAGSNREERLIGEDKEAIGFAFSLETESKLLTKTIGKYFGDKYNDEVLWPEFERISEKKSKNSDSAIAEALNNICDHFLDFWEETVHILDMRSSYFRCIADLNKRGGWERSETHQSELHRYISQMCEWLEKHPNPKYDRLKNHLSWTLLSTVDWLNYTQFYRMILVYVSWKQLRELTTEIDCTLDEALENRSKPKYAAKLYVCYKVIEILSTYTPYYRRSYIEELNYNLLCNPISKNVSFNRLKEDIKEILNKTDYTTLKLRQTLNYIKYQKEELYRGSKKSDFNKELYFIDFTSLKGIIEQMPTYKGARSVMQLLPPPIFNGNILIEANDGQQFFMNSLSSGELQMINTTGSLLYHLRNIDDKQEDEDKIEYRNVVVILEEIELYFHPEYQKKYIQYIRNQIKKLNLQNIDNINLLFVSHSPFILTDVLKCNTLYLEKGVQKETEGETFAGNLYDIMHDSFFLHENAMGNFSSEYVSDLVKRRNRGENLSDDEVKFIGDDILKSYLQS